jgi:four helix bundle protein
MKLKSHKDLNVWRLAMQLAKGLYRLTDKFPRKEQYRMTSQLIRAAISIPANIAEGDSRGSRKDYAHFVSIARGSAAELETMDVELAASEEFSEALAQTEEVSRMLTALRRSLTAEFSVASP